MQLPIITVWAQQDSPRLRYVLDWLLDERLGLAYVLTHDKATVASAQHCISYGFLENAASIHAGTLLWETGIKPHAIETQEWQGLHALYFDESSPCDIQFDMLAGIFFLLSRYEEYLPFAPDRHGRYPAEASVLFSVLERPVVDEWVEAFRAFLEQIWGVAIPKKPFTFRPTYDIDIAWSYRFKGFKRTLGAALRDMAGMKWPRVAQRLRVLRGTEADPYDSFIWLLTEHMDDTLRPLYFILAALQTSYFDKNISPLHPRMSGIIRALSESGIVGMHPSYYSDVKPERFMAEQQTLRRISGGAIRASRQHYIKLRFPKTYRALIGAGIEEDWSMGYSPHLGFRAGTGASFIWYDLEREQAAALRVHPFAFMDTTAHHDLGLSAEEAFEKLYAMTNRLISTGGTLVTIMHNFSLGTDREWKGWRSAYQTFLNKIAEAVFKQRF